MDQDANSKRGRLMGKLFGRDRKLSNAKDGPGGDLSNFLHGPSDTLSPAHANPQMLAKLDTSNARRYPNALDVNALSHSHAASQSNLSIRSRPHSPRVRNKQGLAVRFVDSEPDVIGEGGDECAVPTVEIGKRNRARSAPPPLHARRVAHLQERERAYSDAPDEPVRRAPPSFSFTDAPPPTPGPPPVSEPGPEPGPEPDPVPPPPPPHGPRNDIHDISVADIPTVPAGTPKTSRFLRNPGSATDENRKSFIEINQAKQRQAEGIAFAQARRSASASSELEWEETKHRLVGPDTPTESHASAASSGGADSPERHSRRPPVEQSPGSTLSYNPPSSPATSQRWPSTRERPRVNDSPTKRSMNVPDASLAAADDALSTFVARTRLLFDLFRLHAEAVSPLLACLPDDLARAALWWFLKGRMALEISIREQPQTPQQKEQLEASRQQAYADLAKSYWLFDEVLPEVMGNRSSPVDAEVRDVEQAIMSQLKKLSSSMKRNGFLPPEEAMLHQAIDKSIWLDYPSVSQDVVLLLWGSRGGALAQQRSVTGMPLLAAMPLGDTTELFCFGRYFVDVLLMEQGADSQLHFPCFLSVTRSTKQTNLEFCIASQNGAVQFRIQNNKTAGPSWEDVKWRAEKSALEIKLPRGFVLVVKCRQPDFKFLWSMRDFSSKALATLHPRKDEAVVFKSSLRSFQYFDSNPQSTSFPRDCVRNCDVGLFEKILQENSPTGQRTYHRGFRLAAVTGPSTKMLSAVSHTYLPQIPVQFGFLRGEQSEPALLLRFDDGNSSGRMVMAFNDEPERLRFHNLLIGTSVEQDEKVYSEVPIMGYSMSHDAKSEPMKGFSQFPWSRVRIVNEEVEDDELPETVLAEKLKIIVDFKCGTISDRVNVAPGELKIRLSVQDKNTLSMLRHPQRDMTIALSESQVSKQVPDDMRKALQYTSRSPSVRTLTFTSQRNLHEFEEALTGFKVLFDGIATTFAISRRRMVVPIYKKWEATGSRIQVVQSENIIQVLVFFQDFHHGESMSFPLKPTDVFESVTRNKLVGVKIDDAKFPLPRMAEDRQEESASIDDGAFVSLDLPEIPGEHDDITILFESEDDRDDLIRCLPAPVKGTRMSKSFAK